MTVRQTSKYRERSSRTSSESLDSDRVVNPTRSAKRTETRRRSVCTTSAAATRAALRGRSGTIGLPHSLQNLAAEGTGEPHEGQERERGAPHSEQNLLPSRFS